MKLGWPLASFRLGILLAGVVARNAGFPAKDTGQIVVEAVVGAVVGGMVAVVLLVLFRRARLAVQATVASLAPVASLAMTGTLKDTVQTLLDMGRVLPQVSGP